MKNHLLIAFVILSAIMSPAAQINLPNSGLFKVKVMATTQGLDDTTSSVKTKITSTSTNTSTVLKSTISNSFFNASNILSLLENSLDTTFPNGSQLVVNRNGPYLTIFVADSTGSNVVQTLTTNFFIGIVGGEIPVHSGSETSVQKINTNGVSFSDNTIETVTETIVLGYDDTGLTTRDGTHTKFNITCLLVRKSSELSDGSAEQIKDNVKFEGIGNGIIHDQNVILQASGSVIITGAIFFM